MAPVTVELTGGAHAAAMTITNHDANAVYVQVRGFQWSQSARDDGLAATDDIIVAPPIFQLAANGSQVIRVVLQRDPSPQELTYRLLVDQVPATAKQSGVQFALRLSIPVFIEPDQPIQPRLTARLDGNALVINNAGGKRTRLFNVTLGGAKLVAPPNPYILGGASRSWTIQGSPPGSGLTLKAQSDTGPISLAVGN